MNFVFDSVEDAGGFGKAVLQGADDRNVFKPVESFVSPRNGDHLTKDYSESCIIL